MKASMEGAGSSSSTPSFGEALAPADRQLMRDLLCRYPRHTLLQAFEQESRRLSILSMSTSSTSRSSSSLSYNSSLLSTRPSSAATSYSYESLPTTYTSLESPILPLARANTPLPAYLVDIDHHHSPVGHVSLGNSAHQENTADQATRGEEPPKSLQSGGKGTKIFYCVLDHTDRGMQRDSDFKRHMNNFHAPWRPMHCIEKSCRITFKSDDGLAKFREHHSREHRCANCNCEPALNWSQKAFACGYESDSRSCKEVFTGKEAWDDYLNHLVKHFTADGMKPHHWSYSNVIRNLLRRPEIRHEWRQFLEQHLTQLQKPWPQFHWAEKLTAQLKWRLEFEDLRPVPQDILYEAYSTGLPQENALTYPPQRTSSGQSLPLRTAANGPRDDSRSSKTSTNAGMQMSAMPNAYDRYPYSFPPFTPLQFAQDPLGILQDFNLDLDLPELPSAPDDAPYSATALQHPLKPFNYFDRLPQPSEVLRSMHLPDGCYDATEASAAASTTSLADFPSSSDDSTAHSEHHSKLRRALRKVKSSTSLAGKKHRQSLYAEMEEGPVPPPVPQFDTELVGEMVGAGAARLPDRSGRPGGT